MDTKLKLRIIKVLGGIGYISILFQWLQIGIAWLPGFLESRLGKIIFPQAHTTTNPVVPPSSGEPIATPDFVTTFLITALAIALIGLVAYIVIVRYTKAIRKTSSQVTHVVAKKAVHIITSKPLSARKRTMLNRRLLFWTKIAFVILPLALLPIALNDGSRGVIEQLAIFIQSVLATVAAGSFFIQAVLAARWHEHTDDIE